MELVNRAVNFALSLQRRPGDVVASEHWISSGFATTDFDMQKFHFGGNVAGGLNVAHLMLPQNLELGRLIYDAAERGRLAHRYGGSSCEYDRNDPGEGTGGRRGVSAAPGGC
jgi:hypothetical protein